MRFLSKFSYRPLYTAWGVLFALTALLGLLFPSAQSAAGRFFLGLISGLFFLPPWLILVKAQAEGSRRHRRIVRYLAIASLAAAMVLLCAGILSVMLSAFWGDVIHALLAVICAPLVCSNFYALPMFGWATLLIGSFGKKK